MDQNSNDHHEKMKGGLQKENQFKSSINININIIKNPQTAKKADFEFKRIKNSEGKTVPKSKFPVQVLFDKEKHKNNIRRSKKKVLQEKNGRKTKRNNYTGKPVEVGQLQQRYSQNPPKRSKPKPKKHILPKNHAPQIPHKQANLTARKTTTSKSKQKQRKSLKQTAQKRRRSPKRRSKRKKTERKSNKVKVSKFLKAAPPRKKKRKKQRGDRGKQSPGRQSPKKLSEYRVKPNVQVLIKRNLDKLKEKKQSQQEEKRRLEVLKEKKRAQLSETNDEIRSSNYKRFSSRKKRRQIQQVQWGIDQSKLDKSRLSSLLRDQKRHKTPNKKSPTSTYYKLDIEERRKKIGLNFLNDYNQEKIEKIKCRQEKRRLQYETTMGFDDYQSREQGRKANPKLRKFIRRKHKEMILQEQEHINQRLLSELKIKRNLELLDSSRKERCQRRTRRATTSRDGRKSRKSRDNTARSQRRLVARTERLAPWKQIQGHPDFKRLSNEESERLFKEYREMVKAEKGEDERKMGSKTLKRGKSRVRLHTKNKKNKKKDPGVKIQGPILDLSLNSIGKQHSPNQIEVDYEEDQQAYYTYQTQQNKQVSDMEIIEMAAIKIQKVFRGYRTRKHFREHMRFLLVQEMIEKGEDLTELYNIGLGPYVDEQLSRMQKTTPKQRPRSRSLDTNHQNSEKVAKDILDLPIIEGQAEIVELFGKQQQPEQESLTQEQLEYLQQMYLEGQLPSDIDFGELGIDSETFFQGIVVNKQKVRFSNKKINSHIQKVSERISKIDVDVLQEEEGQKEVHISAMDPADYQYFQRKSYNSALNEKVRLGGESEQNPLTNILTQRSKTKQQEQEEIPLQGGMDTFTLQQENIEANTLVLQEIKNNENSSQSLVTVKEYNSEDNQIDSNRNGSIDELKKWNEIAEQLKSLQSKHKELPKNITTAITEISNFSIKEDKSETTNQAVKKVIKPCTKAKRKLKTKLILNIDMIEEGNHASTGKTNPMEPPPPPKRQVPPKLDLGTIRQALGSEELLKTSARTFLTQSQTSNHEEKDLTENKPDQQQSIFTRHPFEDFTYNKFKKVMKRENVQHLIHMREQALEFRHHTEVKHLDSLLEQKAYSPRTHDIKKIELDDWMRKEKGDIERYKKEMERGWTSTSDTIKRTERDIVFMKKMFKKYGITSQKSRNHSPYPFSPRNQMNITIERPTIDDPQLSARITIQQPNEQSQDQNTLSFGYSPRNNIKIVDVLKEEENTNSKYFQRRGMQATSSEFVELKETMLVTDKLIELKCEEQLNIDQDLMKDLTPLQSERSTTQKLKPISITDLQQETSLAEEIKELQTKISKDIHDMEGIKENPQVEIQEVPAMINISKKEKPIQKIFKIDQEEEEALEIPKVLTCEQKVEIVTDQLMEMMIMDLEYEHNEEQKMEPEHIGNPKIFQMDLTDDIDTIDIIDLPPAINCNKREISTFIDLLMRTLGNSQCLYKFLQRINRPIGFTAIERLKHMHVNQKKEVFIQQPPVIDPEFYIEVAENLKGYPQHELTLEVTHIHNKLIFDAFNDILETFRKHGALGEPYPWKMPLHQLQERVTMDNYEKTLQKTKEVVLRQAHTHCGVFKEKKETVISQYVKFRGIPLDEGHVTQIREKRLNAMLAEEIVESERKWVSYSEEECQVGVELGDLVAKTLINDFIMELEEIYLRRQQL